MCTAYIRNMFNLHRNQILGLLLGFIFVFCSLDVDAQIKRGESYNYKEFSKKPYYFGITLGYNWSDFRVFYSEEFIVNDSISTAKSISGPGFNLGIVTNLKVGQYFDFRLLPTLSFAERNLTYNNNKGTDEELRKVESVFVEIPFHVRYKSAPFNDMRFFLLAGVKYGFDVASDSRARQADTIVKISPTDFSIEYGAGVQFFFPYFIFSPEFKVSQGIGNVLLYNSDLEQSTVLEKVISRTFTISLHFEG